jgi:RecA-family ATPase
MVENAFLRGTVALVSGDGGIGKSLLMQQLCSSAAVGRAWLGMSVLPGRALMIACEDDYDELWRRQFSIGRDLGMEMDDFAEGGLMLSPRVGQDNALCRLDRVTWQMKPTRLLREVSDQCRDCGVSYLIVDTATQTFDGNQNDERQVMQYISELRRLAMLIQGVVIVTKHPSLAGRASGSGESGNVAWNNSVRARWYLYHHAEMGLVFETKKSNYGPSDQKILLMWEAGVFVRVEPAAGVFKRYGAEEA